MNTLNNTCLRRLQGRGIYKKESPSVMSNAKYLGMLCICMMSISYAKGQSEPVSAKYEGYVYKPAKVEATDERIQSLKIPEGFTIQKFADQLGKPRMLAVTEDGKVYVTDREQGVIYLLEDADKDGRAEKKQVVLNKENVHGVAIHRNELYYVTVKEVYKAPIEQNGALGEEETIINDLPDGGQHPNRTLYFGPDDKLYVTVGSTCNACDETNPENATIVQTNPDGSGRKVYAKGLRNTIGIDWHPTTGEMYGLDHGIDWLGNTEQKEELNIIKADANYGWPYIYADGKKNIADEPKEGYEAFKAKTTLPVMLLEAHSAPMNLLFYTGNQFPEEYQQHAFATLHGSWNRETPVGYKVVSIQFENNKPTKYVNFLSGFLVEGGKQQFGRVVGLAQYTDGSLLISDDENGIIYRISYQDN